MTAAIQRIFAQPLPRTTGQGTAPPATLIDQLLAEQGTLQTPAARFAEIHDETPDLADHYRTLIPLTKPGSDEQYAFEVSLDRCTGCKACVSACHSLNGLDEHEAWRDTGTLAGGSDSPGWQQTITTACHHCEDPECMNGCPVGAYEKDADTGIVRHLDDQCIGCSYCILKCPYDVPKYSKKRGIVRKCDMCHQRLAEGEAPACVQACPTEAIRIVNVSRLPETDLIPVAGATVSSAIPSSDITRPTTRYMGRDIPASAFAADRDQLIPQQTHWPLVLMLALTQAGIGMIATSVHTGASSAALFAGTIIFLGGMAASVFHLGQPLKAWRFFLGLRTSWLSREILAFSLFAPIPPVLCGLCLLPMFPQIALPAFAAELLPLITLLTIHSVIPIGLLAIFTSVMIYHDTHRSLWRFRLTVVRFMGTACSFAVLTYAIIHPIFPATALFATVVILKLIPEIRLLRLPRCDVGATWFPDLHSARLQLGPLRVLTVSRFCLALLSVVVLAVMPWAALPILLASEILERMLFFTSVQAPKMPGTFGVSPPHG